MLSAPALLLSGDPMLVDAVRRTLEALAQNQSERGHIPSLAHDREDRGASDTTPLFLLGLAFFRDHTNEPDFLSDAASRALRWMEYQAPDDRELVAQLPTSDWRDEQWVLGYGLYVNALSYSYLKAFGLGEQAARLAGAIDCPSRASDGPCGLALPNKPHYALFTYKVENDERCDVLGNSLAILSGLTDAARATAIIDWIEHAALGLREAGHLAVDLPPCLMPFIEQSDPAYRKRYDEYNLPGDYHNGGVWPFVCGFYVAACVAAGRIDVGQRILENLAELVRLSRNAALPFGFNEWFRAQTGEAKGQDWQTWSAALYYYAATCVERGTTPFFDRLRSGHGDGSPSRV
jgi:hypothetical protein